MLLDIYSTFNFYIIGTTFLSLKVKCRTRRFRRSDKTTYLKSHDTIRLPSSMITRSYMTNASSKENPYHLTTSLLSADWSLGGDGRLDIIDLQHFWHTMPTRISWIVWNEFSHMVANEVEYLKLFYIHCIAAHDMSYRMVLLGIMKERKWQYYFYGYSVLCIAS